MAIAIASRGDGAARGRVAIAIARCAPAHNRAAARGVTVVVTVAVAACWVPAVATVAVVCQMRAARAEAPCNRARLRSGRGRRWRGRGGLTVAVFRCTVIVALIGVAPPTTSRSVHVRHVRASGIGVAEDTGVATAATPVLVAATTGVVAHGFAAVCHLSARTSRSTAAGGAVVVALTRPAPPTTARSVHVRHVRASGIGVAEDTGVATAATPVLVAIAANVVTFRFAVVGDLCATAELPAIGHVVGDVYYLSASIARVRAPHHDETGQENGQHVESKIEKELGIVADHAEFAPWRSRHGGGAAEPPPLQPQRQDAQDDDEWLCLGISRSSWDKELKMHGDTAGCGRGQSLSRFVKRILVIQRTRRDYEVVVQGSHSWLTVHGRHV